MVTKSFPGLLARENNIFLLLEGFFLIHACWAVPGWRLLQHPVQYI